MHADRARILYLVGRHGGYSAALGLLAWLAERTGRTAPQVAGDPFPARVGCPNPGPPPRPASVSRDVFRDSRRI